MDTKTIKIDGMHCEGCAQRLKRVLEREPGVGKANVSYKSGEAHVEFDGQRTTPARLTDIIERAGYETPPAT
ncbi:MAG: hypothetical protein NVS4B3_13770 [Gemmatimonadaceae bacterium]